MNPAISLALAAVLSAPSSKPPKPERPVKPAAAPAGQLSVGQARVTRTELALDTQDDARRVAESYLKALSGQGDDAARETLLGGATLNSRLEVLSNWKIVAREPMQAESGELADVSANVDALDREGRAALAKLMGGGPAGAADDLAVQELDADQAQSLLQPTRARAAAFLKSHPVFAYVLRVDKEVYWHPKNPARRLLVDAGGHGRYNLEFTLLKVETVEGALKKPRVWPLRVLRMRSDKLDTGWRVLPASDWNAE